MHHIFKSLVVSDLWNFELERDDLGYLVKEISDQSDVGIHL